MTADIDVPLPAADHRLCVAPMMDWTDRHERYFLRLIADRALLYTEMVTTGAILFGDKARFLRFDPAEHPVALQLGGADPDALAAAAVEGERFGYDEINLNIGCPSDRVQSGRFGACLMAEPALVAETVEAIGDAVKLPVTVKTRIGIDDQDSYGFLKGFVGKVAKAGCDTFVIHARKALLHGLSPKENREIPPLDYGRVHRLKRDFPHLRIVLNGGLKTVAEVRAQRPHVDGVMIGREAYQNPLCLAWMQQALFDDHRPIPSRHDVIRRFLPYVEQQCSAGVPLKSMTRHTLGLFNGLPGARAWRRHLSEQAHRDNAGPEVIETAARLVPDAIDNAAA
jgi:tRNA-dihydrouridine synthase A